eukprot:jgi/Mesvir1/28397/Mv05097-RA.1
MFLQEAGRQGGANLQGEGAIAVGEPVSEGVVGSDGDTAKMKRFKEQADAYKLRTLAKRVVAEYVQAERATQAAILYSISLDQHARSSDLEIASTWTAAVDEFQKGLSEALATYKGKALKGKGKGKEVEVADAPVSLLEKWEKAPVSQDDDDILDVNDEIAKGKRHPASARATLRGDGGARTMKAGYARAMTDKEIDIYLRTSSAKGMAEAASTAVLTGPADILDDLKPVDVRKAALLDSLCKSAWEMAPLEKKPPLPPAICGFLVLDGNHFTTLIKSVKFELVTDNMTVDQRSVWYQAMLNGFMKAEKLRVVARGGKEQEVTKTVAAAKLEEWATDWTNFGGVDVQMLKVRPSCRPGGRSVNRRKESKPRPKGTAPATRQGGEETDKWGPDQKNFMQRWLFWCEDPLKPVVDGKPVIAQDIAARQDFLDARPKDKAHELSIFTAHRELASFQYFDSLIQAPIMSGEAPPSNLIKIMEVAKNLIEAAKQFAHIKFLEKPELMAACKQLNGTFNPVLVREHVFGVKLKGTFATDLDKFIADCRLTRDFWRVVVTATRAIILTLRDLPPAKRKVVDQKDWKFPRGLLASHPRHLYDDLGVKTKHLLGLPQEAAAEVEKEVEEAAEEGTTKAKKGWRDRLEGYSDWKGVRMESDWIAYRTMIWKEDEKRKDLVVTKVVDELYTGSDKIPRSLKDQAFAVLDLAADRNEKWRNLREWEPECIPEDSHIPKPSSHFSPVVWDVVDDMTNALFRGPCRVLLVFGETAHIRRDIDRTVDRIDGYLRSTKDALPRSNGTFGR